jgi:hypothetical protein
MVFGPSKIEGCCVGNIFDPAPRSSKGGSVFDLLLSSKEAPGSPSLYRNDKGKSFK